jgi:hypothetical protein
VEIEAIKAAAERFSSAVFIGTAEQGKSEPCVSSFERIFPKEMFCGLVKKPFRCESPVNSKADLRRISSIKKFGFPGD